MSKFKVGDKVTPNELYFKSMEGHGGVLKYLDLERGEILTVSEIEDGIYYRFKEHFNKHKDWLWKSDYFDLVEEAKKPKFKVGDKVKPNKLYFDEGGYILSRDTVYTVNSIKDLGTENEQVNLVELAEKHKGYYWSKIYLDLVASADSKEQSTQTTQVATTREEMAELIKSAPEGTKIQILKGEIWHEAEITFQEYKYGYGSVTAPYILFNSDVLDDGMQCPDKKGYKYSRIQNDISYISSFWRGMRVIETLTGDQSFGTLTVDTAGLDFNKLREENKMEEAKTMREEEQQKLKVKNVELYTPTEKQVKRHGITIVNALGDFFCCRDDRDDTINIHKKSDYKKMTSDGIEMTPESIVKILTDGIMNAEKNEKYLNVAKSYYLVKSIEYVDGE